MKISSFIGLIAAIILFTGLSFSQNKEEHPGKVIFMDSKCSNCHSVQSNDITAKTKRKDAPDLSNVGSTFRANFLEKFLKKQEKIDEKQHPLAFKGSDDQLEKLAEWLSSLNTGEKTGTTKTGEKKSGTDKSNTKMDTTGSNKK